MWLIAEYQPSTLFSLRPASATTGGGKTLVTPTPFALKMALLDAAIRVHGCKRGKGWFEQIRDLAIGVQLPQHFSVVSMFTKIRRPFEIKDKKEAAKKIAKAKSEKKWPWDSSISFREFVQYSGALRFAFEKPSDAPLEDLLAQINYLGKRGCFVQFTGRRNECPELPQDFVLLNPKPGAPFRFDGVLQMLDDCGPEMTFDDADIYSGKELKLDKPNGRMIRPVVLPYRQVQTSRGYVLYEHIS